MGTHPVRERKKKNFDKIDIEIFYKRPSLDLLINSYTYHHQQWVVCLSTFIMNTCGGL